jgi:hypothetical protein
VNLLGLDVETVWYDTDTFETMVLLNMDTSRYDREVVFSLHELTLYR